MMNKFLTTFVLLTLSLSTVSLNDCLAQDKPTEQDLFEAARKGQLDVIKKAVESGVDVNSKTAYGSTALFFACDRGHSKIVEYLLDKGADPNLKDTFYGATPFTWAQSKGHNEVVDLLIKSGAEGVDNLLFTAIRSKKLDRAQLIIEGGGVKKESLPRAKYLAAKNDKDDSTEWVDLFTGMEIEDFEPFEPTPEELEQYVGSFASKALKIKTFIQRKRLRMEVNGQKMILSPVKKHHFTIGPNTVTFDVQGDSVAEVVLNFSGNELKLKPATETEPEPENTDAASESASEPESKKAEFAPDSAESLAADLAVASSNWPGFKGNGSRGVGEGQKPPTEWDLTTEEPSQIAWETKIPGLGNSCPSVWGEHLYITSAVSSDDSGDVKIGQYGDVASVEDDSDYEFIVYCLNKKTGEIVWQKTAHKGKPAVKRHAKSSHANPTVATDGKYVVAFFGTEGLYCYTEKGDLVWKKDLGLLDSGWFYDPGYQWGFGSSPTIFEGRLFVQCDIQNGSFIACFDLESGDELWRTKRDEIPGWSSPTVHRFGDLPMLITQGTRAARGYDARTGTELWTLPKQSEIVVPTPFVAHGLIYIASGYRPIQPIYAIRPSARGDISLVGESKTSEHISWSEARGGPYMPSPIVYGDYLYVCSNSGILDCYEAKSGSKVYRSRIKVKGGRPSFTASPVAADGHLYFTNEDGKVIVAKAGPEFEIVSTNDLGKNTLATPAISDGMMYFRTQESVVAVGKNK